MALLLQSKDHGELLDVIDDLRSQGISRYVDLPQLVVCGDQSSGKSSVLEAVSGIPFPRKDNLCTRFATEVILRRFSESSTHVSIVPAPDRSEGDRKRLLDFQRHHVSLEEIESLIGEAKAIMRLDNEAGAFTHDVLRIEVSGPSQPHLTLVDLPGLFQASNKAQSDEDAEAVTSLVLTYMMKRRSIILAVVSAKNDFANQIVTRYARDLDPEGNRTLGIVTKPDTLHAGSDSEKAFAELAENKDVTFRLGWHVVKNRDYDTRHISTTERDEAEQQFFSQGIWATLPRRQVGVSSLKPRLSTLLRDQIMTEVPQLIDDVEAEVRECHAKLAKLGAPRSTVTDQRLYLLGISQKFTTLIQSAVDGVYSDHFFESATTDRGYRKRLRAVVQNHLLDFAKTMRQLGHAKHIMPHVTKKQRAANSRLITGDEFICQVLKLMQRSRGCELPGTYNPQIIRDLFFQQSKPWQSIVEQFAEEIWESSMSTANLILDYVSDEMTALALRNLIIGPMTDSIKEKVANTIGQIMLPHQTGHPITYNHYLTENIQKSRAEHQRKQMARKLDAFFGTDQEKGKNRCEARSIDVVNLLNTITCNSIADMDRYACSEAIDCMRAYYKVAIKTLIDDFSVLAQERCLMQELPNVFPPKVVVGLENATIAEIAAETDESKQDRMNTEEKLKVLQTGLDTIKKMQRLQAISVTNMLKKVIPDQLSEISEEEDGERDQVTARELQMEDVEHTIPEIDLVAASSGLLEPANGDLQFAPPPTLNSVSKKKNK